MKTATLIESAFFCTQCGSKGIPIARQRGKEREAGHLKNIYCLKCKQKQNHVECKYNSHYDYPDFLFEFENGNFTKEGQRKMTYKQFKQFINNKPKESVCIE